MGFGSDNNGMYMNVVPAGYGGNGGGFGNGFGGDGWTDGDNFYTYYRGKYYYLPVAHKSLIETALKPQ